MNKFIFITILCSAFLWISCAEKSVKTIHQVNCKYWLQKCHILARNRCPNGYAVERSIRLDKVGGPQGSYKEFKMLFTCN
jgi:hypothetical protein